MIDQVFRDDGEETLSRGPMFGLYRCLYCGLCFGLKRRLKLHYQVAHVDSMPNYERKKTTLEAFEVHAGRIFALEGVNNNP